MSFDSLSFDLSEKQLYDYNKVRSTFEIFKK